MKRSQRVGPLQPVVLQFADVQPLVKEYRPDMVITTPHVLANGSHRATHSMPNQSTSKSEQKHQEAICQLNLAERGASQNAIAAK